MNEARPLMTSNASEIDDFGMPLKEITDMEFLQNAVEKLWGIIDDIDTTDDMCKENDTCFRNYTMKKQSERHQVLVSDGYKLFRPV